MNSKKIFVVVLITIASLVLAFGIGTCFWYAVQALGYPV